MSDGSLLALNLTEARDGLARKAFSARELPLPGVMVVASFTPTSCPGQRYPGQFAC